MAIVEDEERAFQALIGDRLATVPCGPSALTRGDCVAADFSRSLGNIPLLSRSMANSSTSSSRASELEQMRRLGSVMQSGANKRSELQSVLYGE